jgi:hypothetical protein
MTRSKAVHTRGSWHPKQNVTLGMQRSTASLTVDFRNELGETAGMKLLKEFASNDCPIHAQ